MKMRCLFSLDRNDEELHIWQADNGSISINIKNGWGTTTAILSIEEYTELAETLAATVVQGLYR